MTARYILSRSRKQARRSPRHLFYITTLSIAMIFLTFAFYKDTMASISEALSLCARSLIPSLFPFMVISEILINTNAMELPLIKNRMLTKKLLGICPESTAALLLSLVCGFPIGAKCASSLYKNGRIDMAEYRHLISFSNNPSPAFLIGAVGITLLNDITAGILLYISTVSAALIIGHVGGRISFGQRNGTKISMPKNSVSEKKSGVRIFTDAIVSSAYSMIAVCAFVIFFSAVNGGIESLLSCAQLSEPFAAVIMGSLEMTGGISRAAKLDGIGIYVIAMLSGWSGLSVSFQLISICGKDNVSFKSYFLSKLIQSALSPIIFFILDSLLKFIS